MINLMAICYITGSRARELMYDKNRCCKTSKKKINNNNSKCRREKVQNTLKGIKNYRRHTPVLENVEIFFDK